MRALVNVPFALICSVVLAIVVVLSTSRVFPVFRQRTIVAFVGGAAFLIGMLASPRNHNGPPGSESLSAAIASRVVTHRHKVDATCHAQDTSALATSAVGSFDGAIDTIDRTTIANGAAIAAKQGVTIAGWAVGSDRSGPAAGVCLDVDRTVVEHARVTYGRLRQDVAKAYETPALQRSGFGIAIPPGTLRVGRHVLRIIVIDHDGERKALSDERSFTVR